MLKKTTLTVGLKQEEEAVLESNILLAHPSALTANLDRLCRSIVTSPYFLLCSHHRYLTLSLERKE